MPHGALRRTLVAHLGPDPTSHGLTAVQEYRNVIVSAHRMRTSDWRWVARTSGRATTAIMFCSEGSLAFGDSAPRQGTGLLVNSTHDATLLWSQGALATIIWLTMDGVVGSSVRTSPHPFVLPPTSLAAGMHAFAASLVHHPDARMGVSDGLTERLLVEMAYGVLLEYRATDAAPHLAARTVRRARMLMVRNRADPQYGARDLAHDLHVSPRHLQRLFAREGTSPMSELRGLRAELALSLLRDPQYHALTIEQIATQAGFTNSAAMRRGLTAVGAPLPHAARMHA